MQSEIAKTKCRRCGVEIALTDYSLLEQEGTVEIIYK
jgi:hypothetical protein